MKIIQTFKVGEDDKINDLLQDHPYTPAQLNITAGTFWKAPTITVIIDLDMAKGKEIQALEDNLHNLRMKLHEFEMGKIYWTEQMAQNGKNPNREVLKAIEDGSRAAENGYALQLSQIHALEGIIEDVKTND